ncbi:hypothetical protein ACDQ55_15575 [Chitinophaga sp. 30R24]|uniref:hypothetical protein n=1 Tax=Chitinophaga sp. 30R24 TaxID=3248838 RepID=UPI003B91ACF2
MECNDTPREFVFYHADRSASLKEGQRIELNENDLSVFGETYWHVFQTKTVEEMDSTQRREFYLEKIRREPEFVLYTSRLQCIFAANTLAEAIVFAQAITPVPSHPIPIYEIYADRFWNLDTTWIDFVEGPNQFAQYRSYWHGKICNYRPSKGERCIPKVEVLIPLPARIGKIVYTVNNGDAIFDPRKDLI